MHSTKVLKHIYQEHRYSVQRMVITLLKLEVPNEDVILLGLMPWKFPANCIAVERELLGLLPVHPLLHFKLPPPPPAWLTPAVIVKMFDLALYGPGEAPEGYDESNDDPSTQSAKIPA